MESPERIYVPSQIEGPLRQGEIFSNLVQMKISPETIGEPNPLFIPTVHPYAIVVSQDCDLDWDFKARSEFSAPHKLIPSVLFCEMETAETLRGRGSEQGISSSSWKNIRNNKHERYHFLQAVNSDADLDAHGLPELGVDFKRYFSIPTEEVYSRIGISEAKRRCRLISPYLEHFSTRFFYFQFRVALPLDHQSEP